MFWLCAPAFGGIYGDPAAAPAYIGNYCAGNTFDSCFIIISGRIEHDTPARLLQVLEDPDGFDGNAVLLNSSGGNLGAGLRLGRVIRANGLDSVIGQPQFVEYNDNQIFAGELGGICESACAYAFLGGVNRKLTDDDDLLGFHRFEPAGGGSMPGAGGLLAGQLASAELVEYLFEMGVNPRIFAKASSASKNEIFYPSSSELEQLLLSTRQGYKEFYIKPYRGGIIAISDRIDMPGDNGAYRLTALCDENGPSLQVATSVPHLLDWEGYSRRLVKVDDKEVPIKSFEIVQKVDESLLVFRFDPLQRKKLLSGKILVLDFSAGTSAGNHYVVLELNNADRSNLSAAFTHCIQG